MDEYMFLGISGLLTCFATMQAVRLGLFNQYNRNQWPYYIFATIVLVALWPLWIVVGILYIVYKQIESWMVSYYGKR
jgi:hypothetical protein